MRCRRRKPVTVCPLQYATHNPSVAYGDSSPYTGEPSPPGDERRGSARSARRESGAMPQGAGFSGDRGGQIKRGPRRSLRRGKEPCSSHKPSFFWTKDERRKTKKSAAFSGRAQLVEKGCRIAGFFLLDVFSRTCAGKKHRNPPIFRKKSVKPARRPELNCREKPSEAVFRQSQRGLFRPRGVSYDA